VVSGNFLYLALLALKDLEHRANIEAELLGLTKGARLPWGPEAVLGVEINPYCPPSWPRVSVLDRRTAMDCAAMDLAFPIAPY